MDEFGELMEKLDQLDEEELLKALKELEIDCVCPICPSYNGCANDKDENVFCITGKSNGCIKLELGCMCPTCPLAQKYQIGMVYNFYCHRGSEKEQR